MATCDIICNGMTLKRKIKFMVQFGEEDALPCISADHVSLLCKSRDIMLSQADVYNYTQPDRPKKKLLNRFPASLKITKIQWVISFDRRTLFFSRIYIIKPATHKNVREITPSSNQNSRFAFRILHMSASTPYKDKIWKLKHIKPGRQEKWRVHQCVRKRHVEWLRG